jgi:hypothetical protein
MMMAELLDGISLMFRSHHARLLVKSERFETCLKAETLKLAA